MMLQGERNYLKIFFYNLVFGRFKRTYLRARGSRICFWFFPSNDTT